MKEAEVRRNELKSYNLPDTIYKDFEKLVNADHYDQHHHARNRLIERGEKILPHLYILLKSDYTTIRREAAKLIKHFRNPGSVNELIPLLMDPESEIRWISADALIKIGSQSITPVMKALLEHPSSYRLKASARYILSAEALKHETQEYDELIWALGSEDEVPERVPVLAEKFLQKRNGR